MRLIDKLIKSRELHVPDWAKEHGQDLARLLFTKAVCVDVQNVAHWFFEDAGHNGIPFERLSPMFALPFNVMWFEYKHFYNGPPEVQVGFLIVKNQEPKFSSDPDAYAIVAFFMERPDGLLMLHDRRAHLYRKDEALHRVTFDAGLNEKKWGQEMGSILTPAVAAVSFFHCANVRIHNEYPSLAHAKAFAKKHGTAPRTFKVIEIHKPTDRNEADGGGDTGRSAVASHFVRGHFKRYNNLFGSISGMWFWRPHVRGEASEAQLPNYRVHPPTKEHHGKCVVEIP